MRCCEKTKKVNDKYATCPIPLKAPRQSLAQLLCEYEFSQTHSPYAMPNSSQPLTHYHNIVRILCRPGKHYKTGKLLRVVT